jgi:uncharacterized protein YaiI (UPF0178 family)
MRFSSRNTGLFPNELFAKFARMSEPAAKPIEIFVDADACPVKEEIYRVARRYELHVYVVSNGGVRVPADPLIEMVVVAEGPDAADDWIVARVARGDVVVTADIPLAHRCLQLGAEVIGPTGRPFTTASIGSAMAQRGLMEHLRSTGEITGGPRPFAAGDRSRFLSALDEAINRSKRAHRAK